MPGTRRPNRTARLESIRRYLYDRGLQGATVIEIADFCQVHRSLIYRDLEDLSDDGEPIYQEGSRWFLNRELFVDRIRITLYEAVAIFLASRLLTQQSAKHNPHTVNALDKLSAALMPVHGVIGTHIHQAADSVRQRRAGSSFVKVLEVFARAWSEQCWVEVTCLGAKNETWETRKIAPYYLEVSSIGYTTYVIGLDSIANKVKTFKLERVATANLCPFEPFVIPETFDPQERLGNAWGLVGSVISTS